MMAAMATGAGRYVLKNRPSHNPTTDNKTASNSSGAGKNSQNKLKEEPTKSSSVTVEAERNALRRIADKPKNPRIDLSVRDRLSNAKAVKDLNSGILPGNSSKGTGTPRNMAATANPNKTAEDFAIRMFNGEKINKQLLSSKCIGCWTAVRKDGTRVNFRPAGQASEKTPKNMATVEVNNPKIESINVDSSGKGKQLKLKFPSL